MTEKHGRERHRRKQHQHGEADPDGKFPPASATQAAGEMVEAFDGAGRTEGVDLGVRHGQSVGPVRPAAPERSEVVDQS